MLKLKTLALKVASPVNFLKRELKILLLLGFPSVLGFCLGLAYTMHKPSLDLIAMITFLSVVCGTMAAVFKRYF